MVGAGYRFRRDVAARRVEDAWYVLGADNAFHAVTDPVGALLLDEIDARPGSDGAALAARVVDEFEVAPEVAGDDVRSFLDDLVRRGVLEEVPPSP